MLRNFIISYLPKYMDVAGERRLCIGVGRGWWVSNYRELLLELGISTDWMCIFLFCSSLIFIYFFLLNSVLTLHCSPCNHCPYYIWSNLCITWLAIKDGIMLYLRCTLMYLMILSHFSASRILLLLILFAINYVFLFPSPKED